METVKDISISKAKRKWFCIFDLTMMNDFSRVSTINLTHLSLLKIMNTYGRFDFACRKNEVFYAFLQSGD